MSDILKCAALGGVLLGLCAEGKGEVEEAEAIEAEARLYFVVPGIERPSNWEELSIEEKRRRVAAVRKVALEKR